MDVDVGPEIVMPSTNINHVETDQKMYCLLCNCFLNCNQDFQESSQQDHNYSNSSNQMEEESDCLVHVKLELNEESEILGWSEPDRDKKYRYKSKSLHRQLFQFARGQVKVIMNKIDKLQKVPATATALFCQTCERQLCELHDLWQRLTTIRTEFKVLSRQVEKEFQNTYLVRVRSNTSCPSPTTQTGTTRSSTRLLSRRKHAEVAPKKIIIRDSREDTFIGFEGKDFDTHDRNHSDEDWIPSPECNVESSDENDNDQPPNRAATKAIVTADAFEGQACAANTNSANNTVDLCLVKADPDEQVPTGPKPKRKRDRTKGGPFPCEYCPKVFARRSSRGVHTRIHTGVKPYVCEHCDKRFNKLGNMQVHLLTHSKIKKYVCHVCGNKFALKATLGSHLAHIHEIFENPYCCQLCPRKYVKRSYLRRHMTSAHEPKQPKPRKPRRSKLTKKELQESLGSIHGSKKRKRSRIALKNPCDACVGTHFDTRELLKEHQRKEHGIGEKGEGLLKCTSCTRTFVIEAKHNHHTMACQSGKFACDECSSVFGTRGMRWGHIVKEHHRGLVCQVCGRIFNDATNLSRHVKTMHEGERPFKCTVSECEATFSSNVSLKLHMTRHTGQKPIKCDLCDERFWSAFRKREHLVKKHLDVYLREKPVYCKYCWKNFSYETEVQEHLVQVHDKFTCKTCDPPRVFTTNTRLKVHTLIHTGEKPFQCPQCSKCFNKSENLQEHIYRHTGERPYICEHCGTGFLRKKEMHTHIQRVHVTQSTS